MSKERYISVNDRGDLVMVTENDGYSMNSRGPERVEKPVTLQELKGTRYFEQAKRLLAKS